ncbi:MAG: tRNA 2-thiouridine(34) synthase MnmA [Candidatus Nealsonbacteria bacterium CG_4_10_14_0_2_um_filter_40_15]|uniref:tRNA-specific 2-thiouridylase MnmA n=1 Tax=Candidatus Nealsonbacteria bacterium CG_4_10_14_0_2_um_filter_40_15 TaxID=1974682 RepID=A0A2M7UV45_9BACT|nr:MAG: tRNA 2-thiouridine(34) synthase MnmA [Candidatus Nealsonbacteria bacterium CG_4_10_14_0_2_um_filter_40_15]
MRKEKAKRNKVLIAMSGGVDSSVAAALLKRGGFYPELGRRVEVVGVFMKFWSEPGNNNLTKGWNRCCSPDSEKRARQVAKILNIPFYVVRFEKEFKKRIVDYFLEEHRAGPTPNPCVICNKEIKFGLLLEKALALDADFIATGHYARLRKTKDGFHLLRSKDKDKDQSYFLWQLSQKQLGRVLFPIENYTRAEVEKLAKKFKLPFSGVRKSQEICFILDTVEDFLKRHIKAKPGKIMTVEGKKIGEHSGLWFYTIGQRKGMGLSGGPYYVSGKDFKKNALIVTKNEKDLYKKELTAKNVTWISGEEPKLPLKIKAKIRYRHKLDFAVVNSSGRKTVRVVFDKPQRAITPGQSVVFYKGGELLGGGIIK